jgi:hypothetical protein
MIGRWLLGLLGRKPAEAAPALRPLHVVWSEAAIAAAGAGLPKLRIRVRAEVAEIAPETHGWLMHGVLADPEDPEHGVFLCHGEEAEDGWMIFVRLGQFEPMAGMDIDGPDGVSQPMMMPKTIERPDNEIFEENEHRAG